MQSDPRFIIKVVRSVINIGLIHFGLTLISVVVQYSCCCCRFVQRITQCL